MVMQIVKMAPMKTRKCAINEPVIQIPNLHAETENAYLNYGCVTLITIVEMTQMSPLTCADKRIVPPDGNVARAEPITGAFPSGYSVMVKMTAVITLMNFLNIVHNVTLKQTLNVRIIDAFQSNGNVTFLMIVQMDLMNWKKNVKVILSQIHKYVNFLIHFLISRFIQRMFRIRIPLCEWQMYFISLAM